MIQCEKCINKTTFPSSYRNVSTNLPLLMVSFLSICYIANQSTMKMASLVNSSPICCGGLACAVVHYFMLVYSRRRDCSSGSVASSQIRHQNAPVFSLFLLVHRSWTTKQAYKLTAVTANRI